MATVSKHLSLFLRHTTFTANFFQIFLAPHSFSVLKFEISILLSLLIVPVSQAPSLASSMTPCVEYLTDRIFNKSLKYYVLVRYVSHSDLTTRCLAQNVAQFVEKQYICIFGSPCRLVEQNARSDSSNVRFH